MSNNAAKTYVCGYSNCLHHGEPVETENSVVIGKKHYHPDCAELKQAVKECVDIYIKDRENKSDAVIANRIITNMVIKNNVSIDFIRRKLKRDTSYYKDKPVFALYGLRKIFWQNEMK